MKKSSPSKASASGTLSPGDYATSGVPVVFVTSKEAYHEESSDDEEYYDIFPLPASRYRYSKWHELDDMEVTSDMLQCPRVRKGPKGFKIDTIWMLEEDEQLEAGEINDNDNKKRKKRWKRKKKKHDYRNKLENWEQCTCVNLSYQDLGHGYQTKEFIRVLRKLIRAESIELIENGLADLTNTTFPSCRCLYLQRNFFQNLKKLPKMPNVEQLSLQQNNIAKLDGLELLNVTKIHSLSLQDNPVTLKPGYRKRVFDILPNLKLLDGLPKLPEDSEELPDSLRDSSTCAIT